MPDLGEQENRLLDNRWWSKWAVEKLIDDAPDKMNT